MRFILARVFIFVALPAFAISKAESAHYFSTLTEMPVPPGMTEEAQSAVNFDQPEGRVIVLQAVGQGRDLPQSALRFYRATLPALGWKSGEQGVYRRNGEKLVLEMQEIPGKPGWQRLNIRIQPQ